MIEIQFLILFFEDYNVLNDEEPRMMYIHISRLSFIDTFQE